MHPADDDTATIGPDGSVPERAEEVPPTLHDSTPVTRAAYEIWTECRGDTDRIVARLYLEDPGDGIGGAFDGGPLPAGPEREREMRPGPQVRELGAAVRDERDDGHARQRMIEEAGVNVVQLMRLIVR